MVLEVILGVGGGGMNCSRGTNKNAGQPAVALHWSLWLPERCSASKQPRADGGMHADWVETNENPAPNCPSMVYAHQKTKAHNQANIESTIPFTKHSMQRGAHPGVPVQIVK